MDYKDIKKGMKRQELDKMDYNIRVFFSIVLGCIVGAICQNFWIGLFVFGISGYMAYKKYFEI